MAVGGTTISAGIADSQLQLAGATAAGSGTDLAQLASAYRGSGGGPTLAWLGFNPFQLIATGPFHYLYWSLVVIFLGIMAVTAMQQALRGRQTMTARHPLAALAQVNFRLLIGALIVANTPLLYALLITINTAASQAVQAMAAQSMGALLQVGGLGPLTFAQARQEAIRRASARRAIALHPAGASREEMVQLGLWYNALSDAIDAELSRQGLPGQLPRLDATVWTEAQTPDDRVAAYVGRTLVQNFSQILADLAALPAAGSPLTVNFPEGQAVALPLLSSALAADDARAAAALGQPAVPAASGALESARLLYAQEVQADTLNYLDTRFLALLGSSPTLGQRTQAWFSDQVERAAAAAGGFLNELRGAVDWAGRAIGVMLTRLVAFLFTAAVKVLIEVNLFVLVLAMPFWLLPATEEAFYGVLRSLAALAVAVPAYQFIMLFVDALMALALKYLLLGPLATGSGGVLPAAEGAAYAATTALAVAGSGGEIIALATFCYLVTYLFLAVYVACKTPRLVTVFLKGAGAGGAFLSTFATGLIAGASTALATAAVGGGGMAGSLLGGGSLRAGGAPVLSSLAPSPAAATGTGGMPPVFRPRLGRVTAASRPAAPSATGPRSPSAGGWSETARFGLRTFIENLGATSPADGFETARKGWERQQKLKEKEEDTRLKAEARADKDSGPPGRTRRSSRQ
jgi:hypothetical protein